MKFALLTLLVANTEALALGALRTAPHQRTHGTTSYYTLRMMADEPLTPPPAQTTTPAEPQTADAPTAADTSVAPPQNKGPSFFEPDGSIDFTKYSITLSIGGLWLIIKLLGAIGVIDVSD